jgi:serine-type D-Ala-D-Ala carboxypeptidase/endopeptidase
MKPRLRKVLYVVLACVLLSAPVAGQQEDRQQRIVNQVFKERIDSKTHVGVVVGVIQDGRSRVYAYGRAGSEDKQQLNGDSVFEIGSVTKVFTGVLLAEMALREELNVTDPLSLYLPASVKVPKYQDTQQITLLDLATQTSGLPRLPGNLAPKDMSNPYADYTVAQMYEFLSAYQLNREIGATYAYSNYGVGLLGHVLALRAGASYEDLVFNRICKPLGMQDTRIQLTKEMQARFIKGHDGRGNTAANWDLPTLAGAGALRSTVNDLLKFLNANLETSQTPLLPALRASHLPRHRTEGMSFIGLAWQIRNREGTEIIWHNGGTGGYASFIGFSRKHRLAVVALSNTAAAQDITLAGFNLLVSLMPEQKK